MGTITKSIGKNTLGGGNKMNVDLRTYNRSTHNLSRIFRSSMSVGTLVPCLVDIALPGDTWNMQINGSVLTLPTVGPLFGKYKLQIDVFTCPIRLYVKELHNNQLNVGMNMAAVKLPMLECLKPKTIPQNEKWKVENGKPFTQISSSCLLNYLGIKGWHRLKTDFNKNRCALPLCSYWDIYKNYYINKQEDKFQMLGKNNTEYISAILQPLVYVRDSTTGTQGTVAKANNQITFYVPNKLAEDKVKEQAAIRLYDTESKGYVTVRLSDIVDNTNVTLLYTDGAGVIKFNKDTILTAKRCNFVDVINASEGITIYTIANEELDKLREVLLTKSAVVFGNNADTPSMIKGLFQFDEVSGMPATSFSQYGLALKTHQSDIFNNWVNTEWITGDNGINAVTAIDTSSGEFTIDQLNLAKKVYDMLQRIAVSGGTYKDWVETVYTADYVTHAETPIYEGGYSADVEFQEVVSTAGTEAEALGTLAGRGKLTNPRNGNLKIKIEEPAVIMAIASLTPYCDYSMGEEWFTELENMDDLHKPQLDGIGYQDLTLNKLAWWADEKLSVGKQPAWIDYMTSFNRVHGQFAVGEAMDFMVLQREYIGNTNDGTLLNATSYINPAEFNYIFADTELDSQNFWVQIGFKIEARRVMSAKQIPNL